MSAVRRVRPVRPSRPTRSSSRIIGLAVTLLPPDRRRRYARELLAELYGMTPGQQLRHATGVLVHAPALRAALRSAGATTTPEDIMITTPRRPLRCRLRLHDWEDRENPETHEWFQLCRRCGAYHDRPGAAAGSSSIGMANGGMF